MGEKMQRRKFITAVVCGAAMIPAAAFLQTASAAGLPLLDPNDPTAKALGYIPDATKVDAKSNPTYKSGQKCGNCIQFQGKPTDAQGACPLFAGKDVQGAGWCKVWIQKPGA